MLPIAIPGHQIKTGNHHGEPKGQAAKHQQRRAAARWQRTDGQPQTPEKEQAKRQTKAEAGKIAQ
jgi:hypothetical protein